MFRRFYKIVLKINFMPCHGSIEAAQNKKEQTCSAVGFAAFFLFLTGITKETTKRAVLPVAV